MYILIAEFGMKMSCHLRSGLHIYNISELWEGENDQYTFYSILFIVILYKKYFVACPSEGL